MNIIEKSSNFESTIKKISLYLSLLLSLISISMSTILVINKIREKESIVIYPYRSSSDGFHILSSFILMNNGDVKLTILDIWLSYGDIADFNKFRKNSNNSVDFPIQLDVFESKNIKDFKNSTKSVSVLYENAEILSTERKTFLKSEFLEYFNTISGGDARLYRKAIDHPNTREIPIFMNIVLLDRNGKKKDYKVQIDSLIISKDLDGAHMGFECNFLEKQLKPRISDVTIKEL